MGGRPGHISDANGTPSGPERRKGCRGHIPCHRTGTSRSLRRPGPRSGGLPLRRGGAARRTGAGRRPRRGRPRSSPPRTTPSPRSPRRSRRWEARSCCTCRDRSGWRAWLRILVADRCIRSCRCRRRPSAPCASDRGSPSPLPVIRRPVSWPRISAAASSRSMTPSGSATTRPPLSPPTTSSLSSDRSNELPPSPVSLSMPSPAWCEQPPRMPSPSDRGRR